MSSGWRDSKRGTWLSGQKVASEKGEIETGALSNLGLLVVPCSNLKCPLTFEMC